MNTVAIEAFLACLRRFPPKPVGHLIGLHKSGLNGAKIALIACRKILPEIGWVSNHAINP